MPAMHCCTGSPGSCSGHLRSTRWPASRSSSGHSDCTLAVCTTVLRILPGSPWSSRPDPSSADALKALFERGPVYTDSQHLEANRESQTHAHIRHHLSSSPSSVEARPRYLRSARDDRGRAHRHAPRCCPQPQDLQEVGLGTAVDVQYAGKTFVFLRRQFRQELAGAKSGMIIDFRRGFRHISRRAVFAVRSSTTRDQAYAWYRDKVASTDWPTTREPRSSEDARTVLRPGRSSPARAKERDGVYTPVRIDCCCHNDTPRPIIALEALAACWPRGF